MLILAAEPHLFVASPAERPIHHYVAVTNVQIDPVNQL